MQDKITIADAPDCLNTNDKAMWVLGYEAAIEARGQCLHQIQEPAAAEQAAWHADLDSGRAQAALPKSDYLEGVNIPNLREALIFLGRENGVGEGEVGDKLAQYVNSVVSGVLSKKVTLREAPQAAPAAVAVPDEETIDCRSEIGVTVGLIDALMSIARIAAKRDLSSFHVQEALKDIRADEDVALIAMGQSLAATPAAKPWPMYEDSDGSVRAVDPGDLKAAAAPVVLPEPEAWIRKTDITELTDCEPETDGWTPLYSEGALLATATGLPAQAGQDDTHSFKNFHRALCDRFGYTHDPIDWRRDQVSLIEHIAAKTKASGDSNE